MDIQSVLIELDHDNKLKSTCGTLINNDLIITTSGILTEFLQINKLQFENKQNLHKLNKIYTFTIITESRNYKPDNSLTKIESARYCDETNFSASLDDVNKYRQAKLAAIFKSEPIEASIQKYLINWKTYEESDIVKSCLSTFLILTFEEQTVEVLHEKLSEFYKNFVKINWNIADRVCVRSVPFGNRNFVNSYSEGVVSNVIRGNGDLIWSDCPTVFGSEGSPVFILKGKKEHLIGMVISSLNWMNGEWLGLTLCSSFESVLNSFSSKMDLSDQTLQPVSSSIDARILDNNILDSIKNGIAVVKNGPNWGSAILLDKSEGIFLTNAHVVENSHTIQIICKGSKFKAEIIFEAPPGTSYDIAVLKANPRILQRLNMEALNVHTGNINIGDPVFAAGYPLYPPELNPNITITSGHISKYSKTVLMTTCSILSGFSGGAILTTNADLIGIITSNTTLTSNKADFPRINMNIPINSIWSVLQNFLISCDRHILNQLTIPDNSANIWTTLKHKL